MSGGEISGNIASYSGGGVYMSSNSTGTFRIVNGTIYGLNEGALSNTANGGAALYVYGTAERGTFIGSTWVSSGTLSTTNNTITVTNGALQ